jgi:hypothetical protein
MGRVSFDEDFFGSCANTWHEEEKQLAYAPRMGLQLDWGGAHPPTINLGGRSVIDVGGGPCSLLLKCVNFAFAAVIDPGRYPEWVALRYIEHGVTSWTVAGENLDDYPAMVLHQNVDEAWIYNVLQHVDDPERVVANARAVARTVRLFEWVDIPAYDGHPHTLTRAELERWLGGGMGWQADIDERGAVGRCFYGVFAGTGRRAPVGAP